MSRISFAKNTETVATPVEGVEVETVTTIGGDTHTAGNALTIIPNTLPAPAVPQSPLFFDDENIDFSDMIVPRLNLVQKVGDLSNIFNPGEIVLGQALVLHEPATKNSPGNPPLIFTVMGFRKKQYVEKTVGGALGQMFDNEAAVVGAGGTLDYKEAKMSEGTAQPKKLFQRMATALIVIERPEAIADKDHVTFPYECEGIYYALALWSMKGTSYTHAAKHIFTARKIGHLRTTGYVGQAWSLTSKLEEFAGNFAYVPVIKAAGRNSEEFKSFTRNILGSGA